MKQYQDTCIEKLHFAPLGQCLEGPQVLLVADDVFWRLLSSHAPQVVTMTKNSMIFNTGLQTY